MFCLSFFNAWNDWSRMLPVIYIYIYMEIRSLLTRYGLTIGRQLTKLRGCSLVSVQLYWCIAVSSRALPPYLASLKQRSSYMRNTSRRGGCPVTSEARRVESSFRTRLSTLMERLIRPDQFAFSLIPRHIFRVTPRQRACWRSTTRDHHTP